MLLLQHLNCTQVYIDGLAQDCGISIVSTVLG